MEKRDIITAMEKFAGGAGMMCIIDFSRFTGKDRKFLKEQLDRAGLVPTRLGMSKMYYIKDLASYLKQQETLQA